MTELFALHCSQNSGCICQTCLYHASCRCPHGHCYDDLRAQINPYDKAHPDKPPRTAWSKWKEDQAYWCRGGIFYQSQECDKYVEYEESKHIVKECLKAIVDVYQDGYISCSLVELIGCEECMKQFNEEIDREEETSVSGGCTQHECPACSSYNSWDRDAHAICRKETTSPELLDLYAAQCGFIRITDSWTLWKYDALYKELNCGNCGFYETGEYSHGMCTNEDPEDMALKERFNGAKACGKFIKRGSEKMPKQKYWTKCGREFTKNSTASVTGYDIPEDDKECADCPFQVDVKEGWPQVHKRWECRAGSKEPNQTDEWGGGLDSKNSIHIKSLHNDFLESVLEYCKNDPELSAAYNADVEDCRRMISVICSSNKKGIAAKKTLIEKFFPETAAESVPDDNCCCENCIHSEDWGESVEYIKCAESGRRNDVKKKQAACANYMPVEADDDEPEGDLEEQLDELLKAGDKEDKVEKSCVNCYWNMFKNSPACFGGGSKIYGEDISDAEMNICDFYLDTNSSNSEIEVFKENWQKSHKTCDRCSYYIQKLEFKDGCSLVHYECNNQDSERYDEHVTKYTIGCENIDDKETKTAMHNSCDNGIKKPESMKESPKIVTESLETAKETVNIVTFDYSTVDDETAGFLQEKAQKITQIKTVAMLSIAKELVEVHEKLSNNKSGTFGAWCESIGYSRDKAENYIRAYKYIADNFGNIEAAEHLQPSLLFAASKPSAPAELQNAVISGDITTHKQYKDLLDKLSRTQSELEFQTSQVRCTENRLSDEKDRLEIRIKEQELLAKIQTERADKIKRDANQAELTIEELKKHIAKLNQQGGSEIEVKAYKQEVKNLQDQKAELEKQLKDKPIETTAIKTVEVIPEETQHELEELRKKALQSGDSSVTKFKVHFGSMVETFKNILSSLSEMEPESYAKYCKVTAGMLVKFGEQIPEVASDPNNNCGICRYADMDRVPDEQLDEDKTWCMLHDKCVGFDECCAGFVRHEP